jgi:tetratricopeptide (TPR) repeat protein
VHKTGIVQSRFASIHGACRVMLCLFIAILLISGCGHEEEISANPDTAIRSGWLYVSVSEFDRAETIFSKVIAGSTRGSRDELLARFGLANAYQHRKPLPKFKEAEEVYASLIKDDKEDEIGAWSALAIARMAHLQLYEVGKALPTKSDFAPVQNKYKEVVEKFTGSPAVDEAVVFLASCYVEQLRPEAARNAVGFLEPWISAHPASSHLSPAYFQLAAAHEILNDRKAQLQALIKADESRMDRNPDGGRYFKVASVAERAGEIEIARKYYQKILKEFPTDFRGYWCKRGLKRLEAQPQ